MKRWKIYRILRDTSFSNSIGIGPGSWFFDTFLFKKGSEWYACMNVETYKICSWVRLDISLGRDHVILQGSEIRYL